MFGTRHDRRSEKTTAEAAARFRAARTATILIGRIIIS